MSFNPKIRLSILFLIPILVSCAVMAFSIVKVSETRLEAQNAHHSKMLTSYLAMTSTQYVVNNDSLGINVLLNRMLHDQMLDFASVYDANNELVAQVGDRDNKVTVYSEQITFQDTAAGYVQVGYSSRGSDKFASELMAAILTFHLVLAGIVLTLIWLAADFFNMWVRSQSKIQPEIIAPTEEEPEPANENLHTALLVLKITPARLASTHKATLTSAVALYGGKLIDPDSEDLIFHFKTSDAPFAAACSGLLALTLIQTIGPPLKLKVGIHWLDQLDNEHDEEKATKHASYLASIGEQVVLASKAFQQVLEINPDVTSLPFHSSLAPDGEVFEITTVKNQALIESQATQLLHQS